ncbi:hypothetical protein ACTHGU_12200 [Chitinophagaceae bacterium MMS25-I14]
MTNIPAIQRKSIAADILILIIVSIITRLPQLLSTNLILDSDECIVALMAKHMMQGKAFPVFFYGQSYGFSLVETGAISLYSSLFSMTDYSIKMAMLTLWIGGVIFFYLTLRNLNASHKRLPLLISLLLILSPVWAVWSMKARGGYLTAFLLCNVVLWLLSRREEQQTRFVWAVLGGLIVVIFYSQPLWLPGLLPFFIWRYLQLKRKDLMFSFIGGVIPFFVLFRIAQHYVLNYWKPAVFSFHGHLQKQIAGFPSLLFDHFHAWYYLTDVFHASLISRFFSVLSIAVMLLFIISGVRQVLLNRRFTAESAALTAVLFTFGYGIFLDSHAPRYLLPLSGFLYIGIFLLLQRIKYARAIRYSFPVLFLAGGAAMWSFRNYSFNPTTETQMLECIHYLEQQHVRYVFSNDGLLEWQLMYYSNEKLVCRESSRQDRLPQYVKAVDSAFMHDRQHTAVVDFYGDLADMEPERAIIKGEKFAIVLQPDADLLRRMEFHL